MQNFDLWRCWSLLTGLSAPWVNPSMLFINFTWVKKDHLGTDLIVKSVASFPKWCFLMKAVLSNNNMRIKHSFTLAITPSAQSLETTTITTDETDEVYNSKYLVLPPPVSDCNNSNPQGTALPTQSPSCKCLEQLSNTSRWNTQKLKAVFYKLTRHAGQEPLALWILQVQLELQLSAAAVSWHPYSIPLDAVGLLHSFPMARVPFLEGKP